LKLASRTTATFTLGILTAGPLAGCTTIPTSTPSPSVSASREAAWGLEGTNLQLVNNSGADITVVKYYSDSNSGPDVIPNGGTASAEGTAFQGVDTGVRVRFADGKLADIQASNQLVASPYVTNGEGCGKIGFGVGDQRDYFIGEVQGITVKRLPDDDWKQFQVTFTATIAEASTDFCSYEPPNEP
jgi:hypothetical protein